MIATAPASRAKQSSRRYAEDTGRSSSLPTHAAVGLNEYASRSQMSAEGARPRTVTRTPDERIGHPAAFESNRLEIVLVNTRLTRTFSPAALVGSRQD